MSLSRFLKNPRRWDGFDGPRAPAADTFGTTDNHGRPLRPFNPPQPHGHVSVTVGGTDDPHDVVYRSQTARPKG